MASLNFEKLNADSKAQLACTLAALILSDNKKEVNAKEIKNILSHAKVETACHWPILFGGLLQGKNLTELVQGSSSGAVVDSGSAKEATKAPGKDEKKEVKAEKPKVEEEPEVDLDMGDMFG